MKIHSARIVREKIAKGDEHSQKVADAIAALESKLKEATRAIVTLSDELAAAHTAIKDVQTRLAQIDAKTNKPPVPYEFEHQRDARGFLIKTKATPIIRKAN